MKHVVITGAASGIGKGIARYFASKGCHLSLADWKQENLEQTVNEFQKEFSANKIYGFHGDITDGAFRQHFVTGAKEALGDIDVLVNCAGIFPSKPALDITEDEWSQLFDVNVKSLFFLSQAAANEMKEQSRKGTIVNITSAASEVARPGVAHYCSSKAAVKMMTQVLALEWAPYGIRVNAVGPGLVETETLLNSLTTEKAQREHQEKLSYSPLNRTAKIEEIASAVYYISSDEASFITGQNLLVDGGYSAGRVFRSFTQEGGAE